MLIDSAPEDIVYTEKISGIPANWLAKSVEKAEDMSILFNLGVDYVQGHYFQEAGSQMNYEFGAGGAPGSTTL